MVAYPTAPSLRPSPAFSRTQPREEKSGSQFEEFFGILIEQFAFDLFAGRQSANESLDLCAVATKPTSDGVVAVGPIHELVLMAFDERFGVVFVAFPKIEARTG